MKIGIIGLGFVGLSLATVLATKGYKVIGIDNNETVSYTHLTLPTKA